MPEIGFLGYGVFGRAIGSLLAANGHHFHTVDIGEAFHEPIEILFLAVPVQHLRSALREHLNGITEVKIVVNLSKGIEKETGYLPQQIVTEVLKERQYVVVSGPSFAAEIEANVPTTVSIAGTDADAVAVAKKLLNRKHFVLEELGTILELELAGALKNVYAIACGYTAGSGGGKNTIAHAQVVALREYTTLIHAMEGNSEVVRPAVAGDLILTCGSIDSRNYQYGYALAKHQTETGSTVEGVATAEAVARVAAKYKVRLPLAAATRALIHQAEDAHELFYSALGY